MSAPAQERSPAPAPGLAAGIGLAVVAFALYTSTDTIIKWVTGTFPLHQIIFFTSVTGFAVFSTVVLATGSITRVRTRRLGLHVLRALVALSGGFGAFYAYSRMSLADAYALIFAAPLFVTALSVPVLKEQVGWRRWSAVLVGFAGVVVMLRPGSGTVDLAAFGALLGALGHAVTVLMVRRLVASESPYSYGIYGNIVTIFITGAMCVFISFVPPDPFDVLLLCGAGVIGALGFLCVIAAYRRAPVAIVAPFQYTQMIWGMLTGYLVWRHVPDGTTLLGAGIVAASGLYILHREVVRRRPATPPVPVSAEG
jgi:drug/metabolite transporter (DMT)-like permease